MEERERSLRARLDEHPSDVRARTDLGLLYHEAGRLDEALTEFEHALEHDPSDATASYNLASALCARGDTERATGILEHALAHAPGDGRLCYGYGCVLQALGRSDDAIRAFQSTISLDPELIDAWYGLGTAYQAREDHASAMYCYARTCELDAGHAAARHMLDALAGSLAEKPPTGFVRDLFDHYAEHFDRHLLEKLGYRAPEQVAEALEPLLHGRDDLAVLDLGCGTGLVGTHLRPYARRLEGVDISSEMLARATEKAIYDALHEADIVEHLERVEAGTLDLVTSVDVFIYLGSLDAAIAAARHALGPKGLLAFTVEADSGEGYSLSRTGRYRHSPAYLESLAAAHGFERESHSPVTLRTESEQPCAGFVCIWRVIAA